MFMQNLVVYHSKREAEGTKAVNQKEFHLSHWRNLNLPDTLIDFKISHVSRTLLPGEPPSAYTTPTWVPGGSKAPCPCASTAARD